MQGDRKKLAQLYPKGTIRYGHYNFFFKGLEKLKKIRKNYNECRSKTETGLCYLITNLNSTVTSACVS